MEYKTVSPAVKSLAAAGFTQSGRGETFLFILGVLYELWPGGSGAQEH